MVSRHEHRTWISDNWKRSRDMVRWIVLHSVPFIRKSLRFDNTQGSLQSGMPARSQQWNTGKSCDGLGSHIMVQYSVGPIITLHGRITARNHVGSLVNHVQPMIQTLFPNNDAVFKDHNVPFAQMELFRRSLKSMMANSDIFPGQHTHQIRTSLNHSGQFWRLDWGTDSHLQHLYRNLKMVFKINCTKFR
jgi:hypothetical protein